MRKRKLRGLSKRRRQQGNEWLVPFVDDMACIYHGHEDSNDHSMCGPQIFCCPNAARVFLKAYPDGIPPLAVWEFMEDSTLLGWTLPKVFYFFFCDLDDLDTIFFVGVERPNIRKVLLKEVSLHQWEDVAHRISTKANKRKRRTAKFRRS